LIAGLYGIITLEDAPLNSRTGWFVQFFHDPSIIVPLLAIEIHEPSPAFVPFPSLKGQKPVATSQTENKGEVNAPKYADASTADIQYFKI
jgi:hypothetical protein